VLLQFLFHGKVDSSFSGQAFIYFLCLVAPRARNKGQIRVHGCAGETPAEFVSLSSAAEAFSVFLTSHAHVKEQDVFVTLTVISDRSE
jgi:hypothetical protein